eukprot:m.110748 g.110748  ORF g.110748 m.110748 type:complete len:137 (-) comp19202_c0_seq3:28-438(-)
MLLTLSVVVLGALLAYYGSSIMGAVNGIVSRTVPTPTVTSFYDLVARDIKGRDVSFTRFRGKVVCVVNVATNCGLTNDNYKEVFLSLSHFLSHTHFLFNCHTHQIFRCSCKFCTSDTAKRVCKLNCKLREKTFFFF